jgi:hypothetical protein
MKRCLMQKAAQIFPLLLLVITGHAVAVPIPIVNASFEDLALGCAAGPNCFVLGNLPGWSVSAVPTTGTFKPSTGSGGIFPGGLPDGVNVAAVGNQVGPASISQILAATLQANTLYTLTAAIGRRADFPFGGYAMDLFAGANLLATSSDATPGPGLFQIDTLTFQTDNLTLGIGLPISVRLRSLVVNSQVDFDTVGLSAQPASVPVPPTMWLMCMGLVALLLGARSSRSRECI